MSNPFEQFAQNASGTTVSPTPLTAQQQVQQQTAPSLYGFNGVGDGLSASLSESLAFAPYVIGALGFGLLTTYMAQKSRRPMISGALANAGAMAIIVGGFGSSLSTLSRGLYAAGGVSMLGGSWYFARK